MADLADLIVRLQATPCGTQELDEAIARDVMGWVYKIGFGDEQGWTPPGGKKAWPLPRFTTSLDKALSLVPAGFGRYVDATVPGLSVDVELNEPTRPAELGGPRLLEMGDTFKGSHLSEAIATCIACLKAIASLRSRVPANGGG